MYTTYITSVVDYYYMRSESKGRSIHSFSFIGTTLRVGLSWLMNVGLWIEKEPQPKYNVVIEWILDLPCFEPRKVGIDKSHCLVFYYHNFQAQTILYTILTYQKLEVPMIVVQSKSTKTWHHLHVNDDEKEVLSSTHEWTGIPFTIVTTLPRNASIMGLN